MFARFDEIPSLPVQDIEKTKCCRQMDGWTDVKTVQSPPPPTKVCGGYNYVSHIVRKLVFGVYHQVRLKAACSASEASKSLKILDIETVGIILSRQ